MADVEGPSGCEQLGEAVDHPFPGRLIEVEHHVATEDHIEGTFHRPRTNEIQVRHLHQPAQMIAYDVGVRGSMTLFQSEAAIRQASLATGEGEEALRAKLAEFERNLRQLAAMPPKTVVVEAAAASIEESVEVAEPLTYNVGVTRGMTRQVYQVPGDFATR